jgi:hypothetical protein
LKDHLSPDATEWFHIFQASPIVIHLMNWRNTMRKLLPMVFSILVVLLAACGNSEDSQPATGGNAPQAADFTGVPARGRAGASSEDSNFPVKNLNDGSVETAWGSLSNSDDVYAYVILQNSMIRPKIKVQLFSPAGRNHLNEIRIVARNGANEPWTFIRSRMSGSPEFSEKIAIPPGDDGSTVSIELDPSEINGRAFRAYGIACLRQSKGDVPNHLGKDGTGVYLRELTIEQ